MKHAYLLAHPAAHSLSPAMHNAAFAALGLNAKYKALDVPPEQLARTVEDLRREDVLGANVTVPHKLAVTKLLDALTDEAVAIGAVNTIINTNGRLTGHNTDAAGYARALQDVQINPEQAVVLGAGGAARAVVYALLKLGASVQLYNRSADKAASLAAEFATYGNVSTLSQDEVETVNCDLLVNTTSVGMELDGRDPAASPLPQDFLPQNAFVSDIIYKPAKTKLLRDAEARGLKTQNGLPMLVYQGAESFELWTGQVPDTSVMFAAARGILKEEGKRKKKDV